VSDIEGVCPIIVVPFTDDGAIDFDSLRNQIRVLADGGCHAQILFGLASEFYKLSDEERRALIETAVDVGHDAGTPIWASVTDQSTTVAVEWAQYFEDVGVDGLMLLPPHMGDSDERSLLDHMRAVGEAVSLPIMVQYAPEAVGTTIGPETFAELSDRVENIRSFKVECVPPGPYMTELAERTGEDVDILVGSAGNQFIEAMDRGAVGVIPGGAMHEYYLDIYRHYQEGDRDRAIELHNEILPMLNHIGQAGELFVHYEKKMLQRRGVIATDRCREPTLSTDEYLDDLVDDYFELIQDRLD
jgi:4-hydroxy-tetrahydrodipicolinate synthase